MPRKKKLARELTTEEVAKRLFPKKVRERLEEVAEGKDKGEKREPSQPHSTR